MRSASIVTIGSRLVKRATSSGAEGYRENQSAREFNFRRLAAGKFGDDGENFTQRQIFAAQNITLADLAALIRQPMAHRHIVDMHDIEAGIDIGRNASLAASVMIRPVGVGLISRGPMGVDGINDHRRQIVLADQPLTSCSAINFERL